MRSGAAGYVGILAVVAVASIGCSSSQSSRPTPSPTAVPGIQKIEHVVMIMQENRSFDSYFGTFPGADGIPMAGGKPTVCVPDPAKGGCVTPFPDHAHANRGRPPR